MKIFILEDAPARIDYFFYYFKRIFPGYKIYLATDVDQAEDILTKNKEWDKIFLDHDLEGNVYVPSSHRQTGYTVAKYIKENNIEYDELIIHTQNPVGAKNIKDILPDGKLIPFPVLITIFKSLEEKEREKV